MHGEERSHVVFSVKYHRQRGTNQWKATTNKEPGIQALNVESVMEFADGQWEGQQRRMRSTQRFMFLSSVTRDSSTCRLNWKRPGWL